MSMTVYATRQQLDTWLDGVSPGNATVLLRAATFLVATAANRNPYSDVTLDAVTASVLADATCAQAAAWIANSVDPAAGGLDVRVKVESKLGSGDVKWDALPAETVAEAVAALAPQARAVLLAGGLLWEPVPVGADPCDPLPSWGIDDRLFPALWWSSL